MGFNQLKTVVLLAALTGLLLVVGQLVGGIGGLTFAIFFSVGLNFITYFYSDKIVLRMYRGKEVSKDSKLYKLVHDVQQRADIPMPKVFLIPTDNPNAFATGRNPKNASVACTQGLMDILSDNELKGVIAHEISHIKNRDILIATIAATIAGIISYVAVMARWAAIFGGRNDRNGGLELIVLAILTPLIAVIIQFAISRSREYLADASGARILKDSSGLASALQKIEQAGKHHPLRFGNKTTASLFIQNPFKTNNIFRLFSTHPSTAERVKRLKAMF